MSMWIIVENEEKYYATDEETLLKRLEEYKENYLVWTLNEEIPFTNNIAERGLRGAKTKIEVSDSTFTLIKIKWLRGAKTKIEVSGQFTN